MSYTPTQRATNKQLVINDLIQHGSRTAQQISNHTGLGTQHVINILMSARGKGEVNDGSVTYDWGTNMGCVHKPKGLTQWSLGNSPTINGFCPTQS